MVPYKGLILAEISRFWLENITDIVPNHFDKANERVLKVSPARQLRQRLLFAVSWTEVCNAHTQRYSRILCVTLPEGLSHFKNT